MATHVRRGYHWNWKDKPPPLSLPKLSEQRPEVQLEVQKLLDLGAIYEVPVQKCFLSRIFTVPKEPTGTRLILNVSSLNEFILVPPLTMSNHITLSRRLPTPAWLASLDLKDAYLHVPIRQNLHKFLALSCWGKLFFFRALPFGLAPAPWIFSVLMEAVLVYLRQEGIDILGYLDDLVLWNTCKIELSRQIQRTIHLLGRLGLTVNLIKSSPSPTSSLTWLGVIWDAALGTWYPNPKVLNSIKASARHLLETGKGSRRNWEELCGRLAFTGQMNRRAKHLAFPVTRLNLLEPKTDRDIKVNYPAALLEALVPWTRLESWMTPEVFAQPTKLAHCWTDASSVGWGVVDDQATCWKGRWSDKERSQHINVLELRTILLAVRLINPRNLNLVVWSDNQTAINVIRKLGSRSPDLQKLAGLLIREMELRKIAITPRHIEGKRNVAADALSREEVIPGEWELPKETFLSLVAQHGTTLQVDLFASPLNHKLPAYFCPFPFPQALGMDALVQDWNQFAQVLIFPPPNLVGEMAKRLIAYKGGGVLILQDSSALLRLIPARFFSKELKMGSPVQQVGQATIRASEGYAHFRAWSF